MMMPIVCLHILFVSSFRYRKKVKSSDKTKQDSTLGLRFVDTHSGMTERGKKRKERSDEKAMRRPS